MTELITCTPKSLDRALWRQAAQRAIQINPANHVQVERLTRVTPSLSIQPEHLAVLVGKRWPASGVRLTVGFLDGPSAELRARILSHMNAWNVTGNVHFVESAVNPQVRIARTAGKGHWSYVGTDIEQIDADKATMNLDSFSMATAESEFRRVVRHEAGHTLGFPHEHLRQELVKLINPEKALQYYGETQGWPPEVIWQQVLTPIEDSSLLGSDHADADSIMCYQVPGSVTHDGNPIPGGADIDECDRQFIGKIYPKLAKPAATPHVPSCLQNLFSVSRDEAGGLLVSFHIPLTSVPA